MLWIWAVTLLPVCVPLLCLAGVSALIPTPYPSSLPPSPTPILHHLPGGYQCPEGALGCARLPLFWKWKEGESIWNKAFPAKTEKKRGKKGKGRVVGSRARLVKWHLMKPTALEYQSATFTFDSVFLNTLQLGRLSDYRITLKVLARKGRQSEVYPQNPHLKVKTNSQRVSFDLHMCEPW